MLHRDTGLQPGRGLPRRRGRSGTAEHVGVPGDVRALLLARSVAQCEMGLDGCAVVGVDPAHRITVKAGGRHGAAAGRHHRLSNLLWACRPCHDWCHDQPREAYDLGLMLREHHDPAQEPVARRGLPVLLDDDGGMQPVGG